MAVTIVDALVGFAVFCGMAVAGRVVKGRAALGAAVSGPLGTVAIKEGGNVCSRDVGLGENRDDGMFVSEGVGDSVARGRIVIMTTGLALGCGVEEEVGRCVMTGRAVARSVGEMVGD